MTEQHVETPKKHRPSHRGGRSRADETAVRMHSRSTDRAAPSALASARPRRDVNAGRSTKLRSIVYASRRGHQRTNSWPGRPYAAVTCCPVARQTPNCASQTHATSSCGKLGIMGILMVQDAAVPPSPEKCAKLALVVVSTPGNEADRRLRLTSRGATRRRWCSGERRRHSLCQLERWPSQRSHDRDESSEAGT